MSKEPILLVMAAGMGSRYGGLKQTDPMGGNGEVILDYSLFDARRAGFKRVIFLIKKAIEADFIARVGERVAKHSGMEVRYGYQELDKVPGAIPEGRVKPYGTGHAVLCCADLIDAPFAVINADDYYGPEAFRKMYWALTALPEGDGVMPIRMVGYRLCNTVSQTGYVSRGVCNVNEESLLTDITERTHIITTVDGCLYTEDGETYHRLADDTTVSMNMWGFPASFLPELKKGFDRFFENELPKNPIKAEFYLPFAVNDLLQAGRARVQVEVTGDKWYGVTYPEDKPLVVKAISDMTRAGLYPAPLWEK